MYPTHPFKLLVINIHGFLQFPSSYDILIVNNDSDLIIYNNHPPQPDCEEIKSYLPETKCWKVVSKNCHLYSTNISEFKELIKTYNIIYINKFTEEKQNEFLKAFFEFILDE